MIALLALQAAWGATLTVDTDEDVVDANDAVLSLREALAAAVDGDVVVFAQGVFADDSFTPIEVTLGELVAPVGVDIVSTDQVTLDGGALVGTGDHDGLVLMGANEVTGLQILDFPGNGVVLHGNGSAPTQFGTNARGNTITHVGASGISVVGPLSQGASIRNNRIGPHPTIVYPYLCWAEPVGSCAAVHVLPDVEGEVSIVDNRIGFANGHPSKSHGMGIALYGGVDHLIQGNHIGILPNGADAFNMKEGVFAYGDVAHPITGVVIENNVISGNLTDGVFLSVGTLGFVVRDNVIGAKPDGTAAHPNEGNGIFVFGSDRHEIRGNLISGNLGDGIALSGMAGGGPYQIEPTWHGDGVIEDNLVGTDGTGQAALPNGGRGIDSIGEQGNYRIDGNTVSGNQRAGIRLADPGHLVTGNHIGVSADGLVAVPNAQSGQNHAGLHLSGDNITVGGGPLLRPANLAYGLDVANLVSGNPVMGIVVSGGSGTRVMGNVVGLALDASGLGNGGMGIGVRGGSDHLVAYNVVGGNGNTGINVTPNDAVDGVTVLGNSIGDPTSAGTMAIGIKIAEGTQAPTGVVVSMNEVQGSTGPGIRVDGVDGVRLMRNAVHYNGTCAIVLDNGANDGLAAPVLTLRNNVSASGTVPTIPGGTSIEAIEVFWDSDTEAATYLGDATWTGSAPVLWAFKMPANLTIPAGGRISATLRLNTGDTSALDPMCGDGCASGPAEEVCNLGDPCTAYTCSPTNGCEASGPDNGAACSDGDECTESDSCFAYACSGTAVPSCDSSYDHCEETVPGVGILERDCSDGNLCTHNTCDPATGCDPDPAAVECANDFNDCTSNDVCDPGLGCVYAHRPADFLCQDYVDLDLDGLTDTPNECSGWGTCDGAGRCVDVTPDVCDIGSCDGVSACDLTTMKCETTPHPFDCSDGSSCNPKVTPAVAMQAEMCACAASGDCTDEDLDGFPDEWEDEGGFMDCGPNPEFHALPDSDRQVPNVYIEVDFMVGEGEHTHEPQSGVLDKIEETFEEGGVIVRFDGKIVDPHWDDDPQTPAPPTHTTALEHRRMIKVGSVATTDPECEQWESVTRLRHEYMPHWRRGVFHYMVRSRIEIL